MHMSISYIRQVYPMNTYSQLFMLIKIFICNDTLQYLLILIFVPGKHVKSAASTHGQSKRRTKCTVLFRHM